MVEIVKGKTLGIKCINEGGGGVNELRFSNGLGINKIGGNTILQYLSYSDISLITKNSSNLLSQYDLPTYAYIRILLK